MTSIVKYQGELRCENVHLASGDTFVTDAPEDNNGKGEAFSPTDCLATSLASCMMTIMGIMADRHKISLKDSVAHVKKVMGNGPRRVIEIVVKFDMQGNFSDDDKELLEKVAMSCPVIHSLHPDIKKDITFNWT
jgi:uncharacterized OsmC-like protein